MARPPKPSGKAIQGLLDEKRRIEQWLGRLNMAADKTPAAVRSRVKKDYADRLTAVLKELEGHREEIHGTLERQRTLRDGLVQQEEETSERLGEAELRHAVGEYDEAEWTKLRTEILEALVKLREELKEADDGIRSLEDVLASMEAAELAEDEEDEEPEEDRAEAEESEAPARTTAAPSKGKGKRGEPQTEAFDELAFLKSVTEDSEKGPRPERASGVSQAIDDDEIPDPDVAAQAEVAKPETLGASGIRPGLPQGQQPSKGTAKRTLKCQDCGAMNLPTEWYCEKCGAELATM